MNQLKSVEYSLQNFKSNLACFNKPFQLKCLKKPPPQNFTLIILDYFIPNLKTHDFEQAVS